MRRSFLWLPALLSCGAGFAADGPADSPADRAFVVGVCTHFSQGKGELELNLERILEAGIDSIRDELGWSSVERTKGQLAMPPGRDTYLHRAAKLGVEPLLILDYGNRFYDGGNHPRSDEAIEGFCRYAEFMVRHLGSSVRLYEIWNEWDIGIGLPRRAKGSAADYFRLLKAVTLRIKATNPEAIVLGGGGPTSGGIQRGWLEELVKLGALEHCDILSIHSYNYSPPGIKGGPEAWLRWTEQVQAMLRKHNGGKDVPIHITEMGWPSHVGPRGRPADVCAAYLARMFLMARTLPYLRGIWWYDFQDDGWNREDNENNFGIVRPDLSPKPAYHVMRDLADFVREATYQGRVDTGDRPVWILRFQHGSNDVWAAWSADDKPWQLVLERESPSPKGKLKIRRIGRLPQEASWGHRDWAETRNARVDPKQFSMVIDAMPTLLVADSESRLLRGARVKLLRPRGAGEAETAGGWRKYGDNPVLGGGLGTCFDVSLLKVTDEYWMYFSWRPKQSVALVKSKDGIHWDEPRIVLAPNRETAWEERINRPVVVRRGDTFHMWYTGQTRKNSYIGYCVSGDGVSFRRMADKPVVSPDEPWEKVAVMCPHVVWDERQRLYRMWYSGGEQYEPDAIGYATSKDGLLWKKHEANPIFRGDPKLTWEQDKVTACQVIPRGDWHWMFYIGFEHEHLARIGVARSRDGIVGGASTGEPDHLARKKTWDGASCYKPFALYEKQRDRWMLWYNGRREGEHIGLATHDGEDLGFGPALEQGASPAVDGADRPAADGSGRETTGILDTRDLEEYVDRFNEFDEDLYAQHIPNAEAAAFLKENVPLFDCPDKELEEIYYYRWWTYRKHIKKTDDGFVITEFLPGVPWSGKHNTISCPAGHHFYEGRWLRDQKYLDDYAVFWFRKGGEPRRYSFWVADALLARHKVHPNRVLLAELLKDLVANYKAWETSRLDANGLFWQIDDRDGMEVSIGGSGYRATINSYMYGDAQAIASIATLCERRELAKTYTMKADRIKQLVQDRLWDAKAAFFKVLPRGDSTQLAGVRELHGFTPWYFHLPDPGYEEAWKQLTDPEGFLAPFGPTTAEQRHPRFSISYKGHECQWNGPSWPFATTVTLKALANLLSDYSQSGVTKRDYLQTLKTYAKSHRLKREDGRIVPWIDENLNPRTGDWISRTRLKAWRNGTWSPSKGGKERGKDYNHSGFCDLVISGLLGLRPREDDMVEVHPLLPNDTWDYFCLDRVPYHGHLLTIVWDKSGERYGLGKGLRVLADGKAIASSESLARLQKTLPGND